MNSGGIFSCKDAKHKTGSNDTHIYDGIFLETETIFHIYDEIGDNDQDAFSMTLGKEEHQQYG